MRLVFLSAFCLMKQIAADIERTQFTTKPIGPLGEHVAIRDPKYGTCYNASFALTTIAEFPFVCVYVDTHLGV